MGTRLASHPGIERVVIMDGDDDLIPEPGDTVVLHAIGYGKNEDFSQVRAPKSALMSFQVSLGEPSWGL